MSRTACSAQLRNTASDRRWPCGRTRSGERFKAALARRTPNRFATGAIAHGVKKRIIGPESVTLVAKGMLCDPPTPPLAFDPNVTVQLVGADGGCIETVFDRAATTVKTNDAEMFDVRN